MRLILGDLADINVKWERKKGTFPLGRTAVAVRPKEIGAPNSWPQVYDINVKWRGRGTFLSIFKSMAVDIGDPD